ncbi:MAG: patatin-like phospholipase family protein [Burkholderiales bacterium]|nr:patatin-like phospholipase family protein [Burkholderiales bacterium]
MRDRRRISSRSTLPILGIMVFLSAETPYSNKRGPQREDRWSTCRPMPLKPMAWVAYCGPRRKIEEFWKTQDLKPLAAGEKFSEADSVILGFRCSSGSRGKFAAFAAQARREAKGLLILAVALLANGCAQLPSDPKLDRYDPGYGYRFSNLSSADNSDSLLVVLTFSGGGTRAAALAYGVLEQMAKTGINWEGQSKRLLDEVDIISAVSGGSYTAAYYALYRDRIFEDFERAFLKRNVQGDITRKILSPFNLARITGPKFGRIDLVAEYLDDEFFHGATYGDLVKAGRRPFVLINASDMSLGSRFEFTQYQFDLLCSDLSQFPLARAVAASSAVPVLFSPLTVWNYGSQCGYIEPEWVRSALENPSASMRRFYKAAEVRSYLDSAARPFIHLLDGAITDHTGLRGVRDRVISSEGPVGFTRSLGVKDLRKAVLITVSAETGPDLSRDRSEDVPTIAQVLTAIKDVPISRYSFETTELLKANFDEWARQMREPRPAGATGGFEFYLIEVSFDALRDSAERSYFMGIPTSFNLASETVDRLRQLAARLLSASGEYQRLLRDLGGD